jgi:hypothetical protein
MNEESQIKQSLEIDQSDQLNKTPCSYKGSVTAIVVSNRPKNFAVFLEQFRNTDIPIVAVVDNEDNFEPLLKTRKNSCIVRSRSKNFSYCNYSAFW